MTPIATGTGKTQRPARAIAVVLAVLFVTFFAFPAGVAEWIAEHCESTAVCEGLLSAATAVEDVSTDLGIAGFFQDERAEVRRDLDIEGY